MLLKSIKIFNKKTVRIYKILTQTLNKPNKIILKLKAIK